MQKGVKYIEFYVALADCIAISILLCVYRYAHADKNALLIIQSYWYVQALEYG